MKYLLRGLTIILSFIFILHPAGTEGADGEVNKRFGKFSNPRPFCLFV